jgi:MFS family permease
MRLSNSRRLAYLGAAFSIGIFNAFNNYTMALWLTGFTTSYVLISLLGNSKSLEGAVVSPLTGFWSDRTWTGWLGRRRPFILAGGLLSALLLALTPSIARLPITAQLPGVPQEVATLAPMVVAIFLFTLTFNMADDIHKALRADLAEGAELNLLSSLATVVDVGGQVAILVLGFLIWTDAVPDSAFVVAAILVAAGVLVTTLGIREPSPEAWQELRSAEADPAIKAARPSTASFLAQYRGAAMFCLVTFAYWSGVNAVLPLVSIYVRDILHTTVGEAQLLPGLLLLSTTAMAVPMGWLGTRFGKRRMLAAGYSVMGVAAITGLLITTKEQGAVLFFLAGVGNSAAVVLAIPLMADLIPRQHMGVAAGLLAASGSIAAPLASLVGGSLSQVYGPRAIFGVMAVMVCVALLLLLGIRTPREVVVEEAAVPESAGVAEGG